MDGPTYADKQGYNEALYNYRNASPAVPKRKLPNIDQGENKPKIAKEGDASLVPLIPSEIEDQNTNDKHSTSVVKSTQNVITNQMRTVSHLFQNANFTNCNFTFTLPK